MRRLGDPLWPVLLLLAVLLGGTGAIEVLARDREPDALRVEVRSVGTVTDDTDDGDGSLDLEDVAPVNEAHATARLMARRGELDEALKRLTALTESHPQAAIVHADLGYWLIKKGQADAAVVALETASRLAPESALIVLNLGAAQRRTGDLAAASTSFRRALALRPAYGQARRALAQILRKQKRVDEAAELLRAASDSGDNADRAMALVALGSLELERGRIEPAVTAFDRAVDRAPADVRLRIRIARAWVLTKNPSYADRALVAAERATVLAPEDAQAEFVRAQAHELAGHGEETRQAYARAVRLDPSLKRAREKLVRLALDREDFTQARQQVEALVSRSPDQPRSHFLAGLVAARAGRVEEAREHYAQAVEKAKGDYPEAYFNLGLLEKRAGNLEAAIAAYRQALALRANYLAALNNLGVALAANGNRVEAEAAYQKATERDPAYAPAWKNLAELYLKTARPADAVAALRRALGARPGDADLQLALGAAYQAAGRFADAAATYRALLDADTRNAIAWLGLGEAAGASGDTAAARTAITRARELAPEDVEILRAAGALETQSGDLEQARQRYEQLLDSAPGDVAARLRLADVLQRSGDRAGCLREAERVLKVAADSKEAVELSRACGTKSNPGS